MATDLIKPSEIKANKPAPGVRSKRLSENSWAVIFATGDEIFSGLSNWAAENKIQSAHVTAVGALKSAVLGYYDLEHKAYRPIAINEQVELLSMVGDIALDHGKPTVHAHVVV